MRPSARKGDVPNRIPPVSFAGFPPLSARGAWDEVGFVPYGFYRKVYRSLFLLFAVAGTVAVAVGAGGAVVAVTAVVAVAAVAVFAVAVAVIVAVAA